MLEIQEYGGQLILEEPDDLLYDHNLNEIMPIKKKEPGTF